LFRASKFLTLIILFSSFWATPAHARFFNACWNLAKKGVISKRPTNSNFYRGETVEVIAERIGPRGGRIFTVKLDEGADWNGLHISSNLKFHWSQWMPFVPYKTRNFYANAFNPADIQGDPRAFEMIFGNRIAKFFGYRLIGPDTVEMPDFVEWSNAAKAFNEMAEGKIDFRFRVTGYQTPNQQTVGELFISQWVDSLAVPVGEGHLYFHDMDLHIAAQFFTPEALEISQKQMKLTMNYAKYLRRQVGEVERQMGDDIFEFITQIFDGATGNLVIAQTEPDRATIQEAYSMLLNLDNLNSRHLTQAMGIDVHKALSPKDFVTTAQKIIINHPHFKKNKSEADRLAQQLNFFLLNQDPALLTAPEYTIDANTIQNWIFKQLRDSNRLLDPRSP
jgi:hypothetical protein